MKKKCVKDYVEITIGTKPITISLYKLSNTPNYFFYFRYKGIKYQQSCKSSDLETSKNNVREICYDLVKGIRQKGYNKPIKLETIINDFLKYKQQQGLSPKTLVEYTRQSKYILEWYKEYPKGIDINVFFSTDRYEHYCEWRGNYYNDNNNFQIYERYGEKIKGRTLRNVGNTSLNRECLLMGEILRYGKKNKGILKDVQIPSYEVKKEPSQTEPKIILDLDEYNNVKKYWMEKDPFIWDCFGTIHHLGLRPSELGKITFSNVHLKEGYVEILNRKSKKGTINSSVPLVKSSRQIFVKLMKRRGIEKGEDKLVFQRDDGQPPYKSPYLSKLFKQSVKIKTGKNMTLHSLRHLFITRYMKQQINLKLLSGVVGHKDTTMLNRYSHLMWKDNVEVFKKLEKEREKEKQTKTNTDLEKINQ